MSAEVEESIKTIYIEGNRSSHFNPLLDSMRIYFALLRFSIVSITTAVIDNFVFYLAFTATGSVLKSQALGRLVALAFNYAAARRAVFFSREPHQRVFFRYILLVVTSGLLSYGLITFLHSTFSISVFVAKLLIETILFLGNFAIQRDFVFTRKEE